MFRTTLGLALSAFLIVGFALWVAGMPRPSDDTLSAATTAGLLGTAPAPGSTPPAAPGDGEAAGAGPESAGAESAGAESAGAEIAEEWVQGASAKTGIPPRALAAYANAALAQQAVTPGCGLGWNLLAAIGQVATKHGTGPVSREKAGPLQFDPSVWQGYALDGDGDGSASPYDVEDAARTAAAVLCAPGTDLGTVSDWGTALARFDAGTDFAIAVSAEAERYAAAVPS